MGDNNDTPVPGVVRGAAPRRPALAIAITSGKGGVGKTNIATNLGIALSRTGRRVCLFDADTNLANVNILLNLTPEITLEHFLEADRNVEALLLEGPAGLQIVPAATGIAEFVRLTPAHQTKLVGALEVLERQFDYLLIDTAAGISESVIQFVRSAAYTVVVITPEPTALTDAFSLIKVLRRRQYDQPIWIVVNMVSSYAQSMEVFNRFAHAVKKYIETEVSYLGYISLDGNVRDAVAARTPFIVTHPDSAAGRCISLLAEIVVKHFTGAPAQAHGVSRFWRAQADRHAASTARAPNITTAGQQHVPVPATPRDPASDEHAQRDAAERVLAGLIESYVRQFGEFPRKAVDPAYKIPAQEGAPPAGAADPGGQELTAGRPADDLRAQIDGLVAQAEHSKRQLTELAEYLRREYRRLYNIDFAEPRASVRSLPGGKAQLDSRGEG